MKSISIDGSAWVRLQRRVASAVERVKKNPDEHGWRAGATINELWRLRRLIDELIDQETIRGREQGGPWKNLGKSKQQAQQRHAAAIRRRFGYGVKRSIGIDALTMDSTPREAAVSMTGYASKSDDAAE